MTDLTIERTFEAPCDLVWQMWTQAEHFAAWYGPTGTEIPEAEMDVRVGGRRRICMQVPAPDGPMRMWFVGEYREVVEPHRLVYTESMADEDGKVQAPPGHPEVTVITVELVDLGDRTRMLMTHAGVPADSPGASGWAMAFDALGDRLAARS